MCKTTGTCTWTTTSLNPTTALTRTYVHLSLLTPPPHCSTDVNSRIRTLYIRCPKFQLTPWFSFFYWVIAETNSPSFRPSSYWKPRAFFISTGTGPFSSPPFRPRRPQTPRARYLELDCCWSCSLAIQQPPADISKVDSQSEDLGRQLPVPGLRAPPPKIDGPAIDSVFRNDLNLVSEVKIASRGWLIRFCT